MRQTLVQMIIKLRWFIVTLVPILSIGIFYINMHKAGFETDWKIWFDKNSPIIKNYEHFKDSFGTDDMVMIVIHNEKGIFNQRQIKNIEKLTDLLWKTKNVSRVDSLTNFQNVYVDEKDKDEIVVRDLFTKGENLTTTQLRKKRKIALNDADLLDRIITKDGKTTVIYARMVYSQKLEVKKYLTINKEIQKIIDENSLDGVTYIEAGIAPYTEAFYDVTKSNMSIFSPLLLVSIFILLGVIFRNFWAVVIPLLVIVFSILLTLGIFFGVGFKLNTMTSMLPVFIIAIGIADSVHFIWLWIHQRRGGMANIDAVVYALEKNILPAFLTSLTTFFGFISLLISKIVPLQTFGIATALGVVIAFLISVSFVPAFLYIINPRIKVKLSEHKGAIDFVSRYTDFILKHDKAIVGFFTAIILFCGIGTAYVKVDTDFIKQFSDESKIRQDVTFIEKNLGGTIALETIINSKKSGGINDPKFLKLVDRFSSEFKKRFPAITSNHSIVNVIKKYEMLMHGGKKSFYKIPESKELVSQYLLLYSLSLPQGMGINDMFDVKRQYLRVTNLMNAISAKEKMQMFRWSKQWWSKTPYFASMEGSTVISSYLRIELTYTMIESIVTALILVTLILFVVFRQKIYIVASIVPNVLPLFVTFGLAGWIGIDLDLGVAIVSVMLIGIAVDDTIHFLAKYQGARKEQKSVSESVQYAFLLSGSAIIFTTIILVIGFGLFTFSDFAVYKNFGFLSATSLLSAMVLDLVFLPALLHILDVRFKAKTHSLFFKK